MMVLEVLMRQRLQVAVLESKKEWLTQRNGNVVLATLFSFCQMM